MITREHIIARVRTTLSQQVSGDAETRDEVKWSSETKFSDEDLVNRISDAESAIMSLADAGNFPSSIQQRTDAALPAPYLRILENRVFRVNSQSEEVRCVKQPQQSRRTLHSRRAATEDYPTFTWSGGKLLIYPTGSTVVYYVLEPPTRVTTSTGSLTVGPQFEEALVQHVCSSCRATLAREGIETEMNTAIATWHGAQFQKELFPYLRTNKLTRMRDSEVVVEPEP